jgi:hypothetical protein
VDVSKSSKYSDLDKQLNNSVGAKLKTLEQRFGPCPSWRYPKETAVIPRTIEDIYVVDCSYPFMIASLRTEQEDLPFIVGKVANTYSEVGISSV